MYGTDKGDFPTYAPKVYINYHVCLPISSAAIMYDVCKEATSNLLFRSAVGGKYIYVI